MAAALGPTLTENPFCYHRLAEERARERSWGRALRPMAAAAVLAAALGSAGCGARTGPPPDDAGPPDPDADVVALDAAPPDAGPPDAGVDCSAACCSCRYAVPPPSECCP